MERCFKTKWGFKIFVPDFEKMISLYHKGDYKLDDFWGFLW